MSAGISDPFATAELRARVLDGWAASPSRFREDANAEEDYALGGYRDRVVVELAQNAADAAARAGVPGRLRLTLRDGTLTAANTGAPLDAAGVEALSTLRASSKRADPPGAGKTGGETVGAARTGAETVGRFGVGFAAVAAVSDRPRIRSAGRTVSWSRERTRDLVAAIPALAGELAARSGHVPVLRLPFADTGCENTGDGDSTDGDSGNRDAGEGAAGPGAPAGPGPGRANAGAGAEFVTTVELPLRDAEAAGLVARLLEQAGPALLLALPALAEVVIESAGRTRVLTAAHRDNLSTVTEDGEPTLWRVAAAGGTLDSRLIATRPAEERVRTSWSVRWAVPVTGDGVPAGRLPAGTASVIHAPTPTGEPLGLPALLLASFPLSPDRRQVAPGPATDFLIERAAVLYAGLLTVLPPDPALLDLVPGPVGQGELDARLAQAIADRLGNLPFLPPAGTADGRVRPRDALLLDGGLAGGGLAGWLSPVLPNLVAGPARHPAWAVLGVRRLPLAELADLLAPLEREPAWWHGLYAALADVPADQRTELGALPVPLADGRQARGPRGLLLPGPGLADPAALAVLGLRIVHPRAAHPLLARLGAVEGTPRSALEHPATRAAVAASYDKAAEAYFDDDSPEQAASAVLGLVTAAGAEPGEYPWLADLALPGDDGDWYPAGELLLPGSPLAGVVAEDAPFGTVSAGFAERHGARALGAVGVLATFGLLTAQDVALDESAAELELDGAADWAAAVRDRVRPAGSDGGGLAGGGLPDGGWADGGRAEQLLGLPPVAAELTAVRDLDLVDKRRWPQALELLTRPPLRDALTGPVRVLVPGGGHADVPSYTAWWLSRHLVIDGRRPGDLRAADSDPLLAGLYDVVGSPAGEGGAAGADPDPDPVARVLGDPVIARALGVRTSLAALLAEPGGADELLGRLADPARPVSRAQLRALWSAMASADGLTPDDITPPSLVRVVQDGKVTVADASEALVLDAPDLWPLVAGQPLVLVPWPQAARLADLLDLPLASEESGGGPGATAGLRRPVPELVREVLAAAPDTYQEHDRLLVDGTDVPWRYSDGVLHAATVEGLAHGLAWAAGQWQARHLLAALLLSPDETPRLMTEADLDVP